MAAITKEARHYFSRDLCPIKPDPELLDVGNTWVEVRVVIEIVKSSSSYRFKFERCAEEAEKVVDFYSNKIQMEIKEAEAKIRKIMMPAEFGWEGYRMTVQTPNTSLIDKIRAETTARVKKWYEEIQGEVNDAVENMIKREKREDRNLRIAKVVTPVKWLFKGAFLGVGIANFVTAVPAAAEIAVESILWFKDIVEGAKFLVDLSRTEITIRNDLFFIIGQLSKSKTGQEIGVKESKWSKTNLKTKFWVYEAKKKLKEYRNLLIKMRKEVESLANKIDDTNKKIDNLTTKIDDLNKKKMKILHTRPYNLNQLEKKHNKLRDAEDRARRVHDELTKLQKFANDIDSYIADVDVSARALKIAGTTWKIADTGSDIGLGIKDLVDLVS